MKRREDTVSEHDPVDALRLRVAVKLARAGGVPTTVLRRVARGVGLTPDELRARAALG